MSDAPKGEGRLDYEDDDDPGVLQRACMRLKSNGHDLLAADLANLVRAQADELKQALDDANAHAKRMHEFGLREEILREKAERERDEAMAKLQSCRLLKNEALMKCSDLRRELGECRADSELENVHHEVVDRWRRYCRLLLAEIDSLIPLAYVHDGWRSTRHEQGVEMRRLLGINERCEDVADAARDAERKGRR